MSRLAMTPYSTACITRSNYVPCAAVKYGMVARNAFFVQYTTAGLYTAPLQREAEAIGVERCDTRNVRLVIVPEV